MTSLKLVNGQFRPPINRQTNKSGRWAILKKFIIPDFDDPSMPYLVRWRILQTPLFSIYLHKILLDDAGRDPHDHPWTFCSFVLRGGYSEILIDGLEVSRRRWPRVSFHKVSLHQFHSIIFVEPHTWTLVLTGPRRQVWGFLTSTGWKPWYELKSEMKAV